MITNAKLNIYLFTLALTLIFSIMQHNSLAFAKADCPLQNGDLIFIKGNSQQAQFLKMVTGSDWSHVGMVFFHKDKWQIIEGVQPVKWSDLSSFVSRSTNHEFSIKRLKEEYQPLDANKLKNYAQKFLGKDYDLLFKFDDQRIYCSELVWKSYDRTNHIQIGALKKIGDYNLDQPGIWEEIERRHRLLNEEFSREVYLDTLAITPVDMYTSDLLEEIFTQANAYSLLPCTTF